MRKVESLERDPILQKRKNGGNRRQKGKSQGSTIAGATASGVLSSIASFESVPETRVRMYVAYGASHEPCFHHLGWETMFLEQSFGTNVESHL